MVCLFHKRHRLSGCVRRCNLIGGHTAEQTRHPTGCFPTMRFTVSVDFHIDAIIGTTIVLFQTIALAHWRHEICPRNHRKQSDTIHVWQNLLEIELHNFYIFYFRVAKVRKINRTKKMWVKFSEYSKAKHKKISFLFCILFDLHYLCNQIQKNGKF